MSHKEMEARIHAIAPPHATGGHPTPSAALAGLAHLAAELTRERGHERGHAGRQRAVAAAMLSHLVRLGQGGHPYAHYPEDAEEGYLEPTLRRAAEHIGAHAHAEDLRRWLVGEEGRHSLTTASGGAGAKIRFLAHLYRCLPESARRPDAEGEGRAPSRRQEAIIEAVALHARLMRDEERDPAYVDALHAFSRASGIDVAALAEHVEAAP